MVVLPKFLDSVPRLNYRHQSLINTKSCWLVIVAELHDSDQKNDKR